MFGISFSREEVTKAWVESIFRCLDRISINIMEYVLRYWDTQHTPDKALEGEGEVAQSCPTLCDPVASLSMGFSRQEYWSGLPFPFPGDLPDPGIKPGSPALEADALTSEPPWKPILKKGNDKHCSNYHTTALISHTSKVMPQILQVRLQQFVNCELPDVHAGFGKGRGTTLPTYIGSSKKQESSRKKA